MFILLAVSNEVERINLSNILDGVFILSFKMQYEYRFGIKKNPISVKLNQMIEIVILSEESQTEKDKYHRISLLCGI